MKLGILICKEGYQERIREDWEDRKFNNSPAEGWMRWKCVGKSLCGIWEWKICYNCLHFISGTDYINKKAIKGKFYDGREIDVGFYDAALFADKIYWIEWKSLFANFKKYNYF